MRNTNNTRLECVRKGCATFIYNPGTMLLLSLLFLAGICVMLAARKMETDQKNDNAIADSASVELAHIRGYLLLFLLSVAGMIVFMRTPLPQSAQQEEPMYLVLGGNDDTDRRQSETVIHLNDNDNAASEEEEIGERDGSNTAFSMQ